MPKLTYYCPIEGCGKELILEEEITLGSSRLMKYKCGHLFSSTHELKPSTDLDFTSVDGSGKVAREYQKQGVEFILQSDFNMILGDQMRLGKTPQALLALKNAYEDRTPALILVRGANLWQWVREYKIWCDPLPNGIFPIFGTKAWIPLGFKAYIISMDTFSRPKMLAELKKIDFKLIIADEAHSFKNTESNRSQALIDFVSHLNTGEESLELELKCSVCANKWTEIGKRKYDKRHAHSILMQNSKCAVCGNWCYISQQHHEKDRFKPEAQEKYGKLIALANDTSTTQAERDSAKAFAEKLREDKSLKVPKPQPVGLTLLTGTVIKNRAAEYFVPLNLIAPEKFPSLKRFEKEWLESDNSGRIKSWRLDEFKELIKPFVLRREKEDVFKDLPPLNRTFTIIEPDKSLLAEQYNKILDEMEEKLAFKANPTYWDMSSELMALRRVCGMMKVMWAADYIQESLEDSENGRFAIGLHHECVKDILRMKIGSQNLWTFTGQESSDRKNWIQQNYATCPQRVGLISMLAGGVGCDFHEIDNCLILERQWSSADEEQFEFRFFNPDLKIKNRSTNIEYLLAKGTVDDIFHNMVEQKRKIFGETVSTHWDVTKDPGSFKDLCEAAVASRL